MQYYKDKFSLRQSWSASVIKHLYCKFKDQICLRSNQSKKVPSPTMRSGFASSSNTCMMQWVQTVSACLKNNQILWSPCTFCMYVTYAFTVAVLAHTTESSAAVRKALKWKRKKEGIVLGLEGHDLLLMTESRVETNSFSETLQSINCWLLQAGIQ